ncbi:MAG: TolC family protein [Erythrobacter sp.]|nr:TolC family protein [Erythrobacter sp.]MDJ0979657.1 TolC family protein [Erythrobacter sp.]
MTLAPRLPSPRLPIVRRFAACASALLSACALAGCISMAPDARTPARVEQMPESFAQAELAETGEYTPENWWRAFEDPVLDDLVEKALASNLDIAESAARLRQARAQARVSRAALVPQTSLAGDASETSSPLAGLAFGDLGGGGSDRIDNEAYTLGATASYELDLFGRARDDFRAARQDAIASERDLKTVQLSTAAETISAYFDYVDTARQIALTERTVEVLRDRANRTDERFERGLVDSLELYQIRQDLRSTESSLPQLRSTLVATRSRLALLLGAYPAELDEALSQPLRPRLVFESVPSGLPIAILAQRPDVAAEYERLEAARLRIGARRAERFPALSFTATLGTQGADPAGAFDFATNWTSSLLAAFTAPLFDGGRITANIASARATYDQQAAAYARSVITAFGEVESALADYEQQRDRYALVSEQLAESRGSLDLQSRRFAAGTGDYLAYLDALRTVYGVETNLSTAARATALARLGLHRALGGDWSPGGAPGDARSVDMQRSDKTTLDNGEAS